ncbi:MAG TPA: hypothetical protein VHS06_05775, partial [Chloroflexota bacterium]|nr:hypothetical protein [Chloroflexota bacterium]
MPAFSDNPDPSVIRFLPDPAKADDPHIGELLKGIAANIKEMEERNRDLEEQNNQLLAALRHAHERIHAFEHASVANPELTRLALTTAAQLIESARESIEAAQKAVKESNADIYEKTIDQVIDYEKRSLTLLENARREADRRKQEVEHNAMEVFLQARDSVLSMARDLETTEVGLDPDRIKSVMESSLTHSGHDKFNEVERLEPSGHSIELTASPFRTFAAISAFHKSILRLPETLDWMARLPWGRGRPRTPRFALRMARAPLFVARASPSWQV